MKTIQVILSLCFLFISQKYTCQTSSDNKTKQNLLIGKWKWLGVDTAANGKADTKYCVDEKKCKIYEFTSQLKWNRSNESMAGIFESGNWYFKGDSLIFKSNTGKVAFRIEKLNNTQLILSCYEAGYKRFEWEKPGYIFFRKIL